MKPVNPKDVDILTKKLFGLKNNQNELANFLVNEYLRRGIDFHYIFLKSKFLLELDIEFVIKFGRQLKSENYELSSKIADDFAFFWHLKERNDFYIDKIKKYIEEMSNSISAEEIFASLEYTYTLFCSGKPLPGRPLNHMLLSSQYCHMQDSFDMIIEWIIKSNISFSFKKPTKVKMQILDFFELCASLKSMREYFDDLFYLYSTPLYRDVGGAIWHLVHRVGYWPSLEKYRDLNYLYREDYDLSTEEEIKLLKETKTLKIYGNNEVMSFDLAKEKEFYSEKLFYQKIKLLLPLYGGTDTQFEYNSNKYTIEDIIKIYNKLYVYAKRMIDNDKEKLIDVFGRKQLIRLFDIENPDILDLLSFDFDLNKSTPYLVHYKPIIKKGNVYFLLPYHLFYLAVEKVIDRILSNEVVVYFQDCTGPSKKGDCFEKSIEDFFNSSNIQFGKVSRNIKLNIPEIDGAFVIDNYVFIYEAKASIKPEGINATGNYLCDVLYKAKLQMDTRISAIYNNKVVRDYIENELSFKFNNKKLAPFILTNHSTFSGYKELLNPIMGDHYPIIDFDLLKYIIKSNIIPVWKYNKLKDCYIRKEKSITSADDIWKFLMDQLINMESMEQPIRVFGDAQISYQISRPVVIDPDSADK